MKYKSSHLHLLLLLLWLAIGIGLRLTNLGAKPPWTDEFSTLVFSLGTGYESVPLDKAIALDVLLKPVQPDSTIGVGDVIHKMLVKDNHPPLYFALAHLWMKLFPTVNGLVSLWGARSLPALLGAASIPAIYGLGWLAFRSRLVAQMAAAMMAVSPFGIFLAQEARHYTIAILFVIASLSCMVMAVRHIQERSPIPIWLVLIWVITNTLGIAAHFFVALSLVTQAFVLVALFWFESRKLREEDTGNLNSKNEAKDSKLKPLLNWWRIVAAAAGTLVGGLVWLPVWGSTRQAELTEWIKSEYSGLTLLNPIFQALAAWITMLSLLPVEVTNLVIVIASGFVMLIFFLWSLPIIRNGLNVQLEKQENKLATLTFGGVVLGAIAIFFCFAYIIGIDLTRGARYNFVYFPAVMVLVGASLAVCWNAPTVKSKLIPITTSGKKAVGVILLMGLLSALTVTCNLGYQKYYRPDLFVPVVEKLSQGQTLIATTHKTHVQVGEMMGVAWVFKHSDAVNKPQFLLAHQEKDPKVSTATLKQTLAEMPRPLDLWAVNFHAPLELDNCLADTQSLPAADGYEYKLYHCINKEKE